MNVEELRDAWDEQERNKIEKESKCSKCGKVLKAYEQIHNYEGEKVIILCHHCMIAK